LTELPISLIRHKLGGMLFFSSPYFLSWRSSSSRSATQSAYGYPLVSSSAKRGAAFWFIAQCGIKGVDDNGARVMPETVLNLPPPPSVNKTRKSHPAGVRAAEEWRKRAGKHILAAGGMRRFQKMADRFEVVLILDENGTGIDLDNGPKVAIDFCKRLGLIRDDGPRYMRRVTIEWGEAPEGLRLILRPWG
jgi:hypothetical protein